MSGRITHTHSDEGTFEQAVTQKACPFDGTLLVLTDYPQLPRAKVLLCRTCGFIAIFRTS